jgi:high-affinity nickel-transport protein
MSTKLRLVSFLGAVAVLHVGGWGVYLWYARHTPTLAGLGALAYTFGLRHAFDADHIAAIDNTTRKLLHDDKRPLGVGFFFSLGHASIVFALTTGLALAAGTVHAAIPSIRHAGSTIGASVSGVFLLLIGMLNLFVLADIVRALGEMKTGRCDDKALERRLLDRGLLSRLFLARIGDRIDASWKMAPLGALFGLGFDTATEIGVLALAAGVATHRVPLLAILTLPMLFAAGMSLLDTADGLVMSSAYSWACSNPARKIYYNITVTGLSVVLAVVIGMIELLQGTVGVRILDLGRVGYLVVALFLAAWTVSLVYWKARRVEQRVFGGYLRAWALFTDWCAQRGQRIA